MQVYTHNGWSSETSYTALGDILREHGGLAYFDSIISSQDGSAFVTTLNKNGASIVINQPNGNVFTSMTIDGYEFYESAGSQYKSNYIYKIYVCDSAIIMIPKRGGEANDPVTYGTPIIIAKNKDGNTCIAFNQVQYNSSVDVKNEIKCICIDSAGTKTVLTTPVLQYNTSDSFMSTSKIPSYSGFIKDVYFCTHRPMYGNAEPFAVEISDVRYEAFGYNTVIVKTT